MGLTVVAPVLGALSMRTTNTPCTFTTLLPLLILFCIGCFSHVYGFVINDLVDIKVDKLSNELFARPLVSGRISRKKAAIFAVVCMIFSFILSIFFYKGLVSYILLFSILISAYILATIYNFASKKYPGMDFFVAGAIFFLILFGAATISTTQLLSNPLIWIVALIGALQVLFMNMFNGAIKDIDHDEKGLANTLAIRLGAKTRKGVITLPTSFKTVGYAVELTRSFLIFLPFLFLTPFNQIGEIAILLRIAVLIMFTIITLCSIHKLFSIKTFDRNYIRKWIGIIVIVMYATTPIMLSSLNLYFILVAFVPPLWFISSNIVLHGTVLEPKTM
jgi:4-hydroxybenzoate polyprenyltransferase